MEALKPNNSLDKALEQLKYDLMNFPDGNNTLALGLESAAKHIPAYLKIVKGHIDQLAKVLELENHDKRSLDNVGLAEPVIQLILLFRMLDEERDNKLIELIELLAEEAKNWQNNKYNISQEKTAETSEAA